MLSTNLLFLQDFSELSCFVKHCEDEQDPNNIALFTPSSSKLWNAGQKLKVSFNTSTATMPAVCYKRNWINDRTIIDWMNEWSMAKGTRSCNVPHFVKAERYEDGDIRVDFGGKIALERGGGGGGGGGTCWYLLG